MLEIQELRSTFGTICALDDVSLKVAEAEFVCVLGPSGCGKSTLLNSIAGFIRPASGRILIDGSIASHLPPNKRPTAMVFQSYALFPHMTVFDNVAFGLRIRKTERAVIKSKVRSVLDLVRLSGVEERYPRQLSGGQQQRVALARALVVEPKVLLLDEPFSNLDAKLRESVRMELKDLQRQVGITTVFVTHDQEEAFELGDRIVLMNVGRIEQVGTAAELYEQPRTGFVATFIGRSNLLRAVIARREGDDAVVAVSGVEIRVRACPGEIGESVTLLLRPEQISLRPHDVMAENGFVATVRAATHLGSGVRYMLDIEGLSLMAYGGNGRSSILASGDDVQIAFGKDLRVIPH